MADRSGVGRWRKTRQRPATWITPLTCLASIRDAPAFGSSVCIATSAAQAHRCKIGFPRVGGAKRWCREERKERIDAGAGSGRQGIAGGRGGAWRLCSSSPGVGNGEGSEDDSEYDNSSSSFPDTLGPAAPSGVSPEAWERVTRSATDWWSEDEQRLSPSPDHSPRHVAAVTLQALKRNDSPHPNHGCEVAIRLSSSSNPASRFTPGGMRTYLDDPSMPFYRILGDWDEMAPGGDLDLDDDGCKAYQQIRIRKVGDPAWSTVTMDLVREKGCWLIERLWVDDKSVPSGKTAREDDGRGGGGGEGDGVDGLPPRPLTIAELFDEDRLEVMSCKYADYDPEYLASSGGEWLEERPNSSLTPKAVALTCIISLRKNDDGVGSAADAAASTTRPRNEGCERVIRFCSPTNVASTLTPAHFAQYLKEPWYAIFNEWDELVFHSEDISDDGRTANLVVMLRPEGEEAWTSVNWELVNWDGMWLTEKIWVVDV